MKIEGRLGELMTEATRALSMPTDAMAAEGIRRGGRLRARRRAAVLTGTAMVVAVSVSVAVLGTGLGRGPQRASASNRPGAGSGVRTGIATGSPASTAPAASGAPLPAVTALPSAASPAMPASGPYAVAPLAPAKVISVLQTLLPAGFTYAEHAVQPTGRPADVLIDDGLGQAEVAVEVGSAQPGRLSRLDCAELAAAPARPPLGPGMSPSEGPPATCSVSTLPDKDQVLTEVGDMVYPGLRDYEILVSRADGAAVEITVANGSWTDPLAATRTGPPLALGTWTQIALSPLWQATLPVPSAG